MQVQEMSKQMRIAIIMIFASLSVLLAVLVADELSSNMILAATKSETNGVLDGKYETHGKDGYRYFFDYHFSIGGADYRRTWLFGILGEDTQVQLSTYNKYETGSGVPVVYAKSNPKISDLREAYHERSYLIWKLLGMLVFGAVVCNELRNFIKQRGSV